MKGLLSSIIMFALLIPVVAIVTANSDVPATSYNDHPIERAALMSLYDSTYGEVWHENDGWGSDNSYCEWYGVTCDPSGHVRQLDLPGNSLEGPIPSQIDALAALQRLDLSGNILITPLPEELGNLAQLQNLDLSDNLFCIKGCYRTLGGPIPPSLGDLSNLQELDLSDNKLEGPIPPQLGQLAQLQILDLSGNYFCREEWGSGDWICSGGLYGAIPTALSNLTTLQELSLQGNKSMCWETVAARNWALTLPLYSGPTDCSYLPLTASLHFAKSAGSGTLTFVKSAGPRDGADFAFDLSGPANPTTPTLLIKWGGYGSSNGEFIFPTAVALDKAGNVYVADTANDRIQKFDKSGVYLSQWGSEGDAGGQFDAPRGPAGNVYVTEQKEIWGYDRIQKFDKDGNFLTKWGSEGSADGQFSYPTGVALDMASNVYVADSGNNRIQKFLASTFVLDDADPDDGDPIGNSVNYNNLPLGRYQVMERAVSGWDLKNLTCTGANSSQVTADHENRTLTIDLAADEHITCTFTNHLP